MAKKKIITKQEKPAKQDSQQKVVEKPSGKTKKASKQGQSLSIFGPEFYQRLDNFQAFYREVLELKSSASNTDINAQFAIVNNQVRKDLETASTKILRNELVDLQKWIQGEQARLRGQIQTVTNCYKQNQKSLQSTKAFSANEITSQLRPIQQKINQKQASLQNYASLLTRSSGIYGQPTIQAENFNDNENQVDMNLD